MKIKRIITAVSMGLFGCLLFAGCQSQQKSESVELGSLVSFSYSPGYSDMDGEYHYSSLKKNENGEWIIESSNRNNLEEPTVVTTYAVSSDKVAAFEAFIKEKNIVSLKDRKDSDDFITDYSPWGYSIEFDNSSVGGSKREYYSISQYKQYSKSDEVLMDELDNRFDDLFGEVLSEVVEKGESAVILPIGYSYQSHPCTLVDPVSGAELITGNYYAVTLDEATREQYPELGKALDDFNTREEEGIKEEMATYQKDAIDLKINGVDWSFQLEEDFIPQRADDFVLSFAVMKFTYLGGAHGVVSYYTRNLDPGTGEAIKLSDVVKDMDSLPDTITEELEKQKSDIKKYFEDLPTDRQNLIDYITEMLKDDAKGLAWTLDYDGITVYFQDYTMGSYAAGSQRATVAFEDFPDLFTDTYVNYKDGTKPDIAGLATNENDAEKKTIDATESMWDYNEGDAEADMPFYGLWVGSSSEKQESVDLVNDLREKGLDAYCIYTPEYENLNSGSYWCVTVGKSESESEAQALIESVEKAGYKGAYVKYTGERLSHRIYFYVYAPSDAQITESKITLNEVQTEELSGCDEDEGPMTLVVDSDTVFDKTCDLNSFTGYKTGQSPLEWYNANTSGEESMNVMGVYEVSITGNHVDSFYGSYWWD
jgi:hypothetical protein